MNIGIDLGTTNSVIAVKGRVELQPPYPAGEYIPECDVTIIPAPDGNQLFPSVYWRAPEPSQEELFGFDAKQKGEEGENPVMFSKRIIGTDQKISINGHELSAKDVATRFLAYLKSCAEQALGRPVRRAVVTHPAYFLPNQVEETKQAAIAAGFEMDRDDQMLMEPTAAALAFLRSETKDPITVLTYDLGGGTFDVTVLRRESGVTRVRAFDGDHLLGGYNFDRRLVEWLLERVRKSGRVPVYDDSDETHRGRRARLLLLAEAIKERLTEQHTDHVKVPIKADRALVDAEGRTIQINERIDRAEYAELIRDYLDQTIECSRRCIAKAGMEQGEIDFILLVGGSTYGPWVKQALAAAFPAVRIEQRNPDKDVASGAALRAGEIPQDEEAGELLVAIEVPESTTLPELALTGHVRRRGADGDGHWHKRLSVLATTPRGRRLAPVPLGSDGRFVVELELEQEEDNSVHLELVEEGGVVRFQRDWTVRHSSDASGGGGGGTVLPRRLTIETADGRKALAEEGCELPARIQARYKRLFGDSTLELPIFIEDLAIGRVHIDGIPDNAGEGSMLELDLEVTRDAKLRGEARVLTRTGAVAKHCRVAIVIPPIPIPALEELHARFEALESQREQDEQFERDPARRIGLAAAKKLAKAIERKFGEMQPDRQEIFLALKDFELRVRPPSHDMNPPRKDFIGLVEHCRQAIDRLGAGAEKGVHSDALQRIEAQGMAAYENRNEKKWSQANDQLRVLASRLEPPIEPKERVLPPTEILKELFLQRVGQVRKALEVARAKREVEADFQSAWKARSDAESAVLDSLERAIEKVADELDPKTALPQLQLATRALADVVRRVEFIDRRVVVQ